MQTANTSQNGETGDGLGREKKSRPVKADSGKQSNGSTFDPMKYMLKLPKNKKVALGNGQVRWEKSEADYLPVAARRAFRFMASTNDISPFKI
jgi:ubiquinone/menaquinone biosynthesis C-methylase UbiE